MLSIVAASHLHADAMVVYLVHELDGVGSWSFDEHMCAGYWSNNVWHSSNANDASLHIIQMLFNRREFHMVEHLPFKTFRMAQLRGLSCYFSLKCPCSQETDGGQDVSMKYRVREACLITWMSFQGIA